MLLWQVYDEHIPIDDVEFERENPGFQQHEQLNR